MNATDAEHARLRPNHKQGYSGVDTFCVECVAELEAALDKPLRETILAVLTTMPADAQPEHLAAMIEAQVRAWQAIPGCT